MRPAPVAREAIFRGRLSWTLGLVLVNAAAFVLQELAYRVLPRFPTNEIFALSVQGLKSGFLWQLLTFQFMHGGLWHLLLNCWVIYMFGRDMETTLGGRNLLLLYFGSGVIGGVFQMLAAGLFPTQFGGAVVGASAGAFGLVAAFAMLYPQRPLTLLLFFVLPITLRARYLLLISGLLALFGILFPRDAVAHAAHLGGMFAGMAFIRRMSRRAVAPNLAPPVPRRRPLLVATRRRQGSEEPTRPVTTNDLPADEFIRRKVDPILDKISTHGLHSLTEGERQILEIARKKMGPH
jgi:membrane associated rhomboid family serine protease